MNQILETKSKNKNLIKFLKIQFITSVIAIIILFIYILNKNIVKNKEENISKIVAQNAKIFGIYSDDKEAENNNLYFCTLKIEKIDLEYFVYKNYSENLLKILPCKFYGNKIDEDGNICIISHNYFDNRFFGRLNELRNGDLITLVDFNNNEYNYKVYSIFEIYENETQKVLENNYNRELTLCTCTVLKNKRLIIKAKAI